MERMDAVCPPARGVVAGAPAPEDVDNIAADAAAALMTDAAATAATDDVAAVQSPAAIAPAEGIAKVIRTFNAVEIAVIMVAVLAAIAAARVAEPFLVPVLAGILLSYTLRPLVSALESVHVPRIAGAALVITALVALISATVWAIRDDVNGALAELPSAARKLRVAAVKASRESPGPMTHMKEAAAELDRAAAEAAGKSPALAAAAAQGPGGVGAEIQSFITEQSSKALVVVSEIFVAIMLAFFLLASGDTFRRKVAHLAGASLARRRVTVEALNEIDAQIQAYMMTLLIANSLVALTTWGALALLGLPNAGMWGAIVGALHVIPYAGTVIAAAAVGVAAFLQQGSITDAMLAMGVIVVIAALIGIGLTTWMQGRACRMNAVAAFIGVLFFGWLWGGWGLLLGVPLLAVLKSVSDRVEFLHPVSELLGD
jgi:predicted PurR-regulated permease PerM